MCSPHQMIDRELRQVVLLLTRCFRWDWSEAHYGARFVLMLLKEFDKAGGEILYGMAIDAETRSLNAVSDFLHLLIEKNKPRLK